MSAPDYEFPAPVRDLPTMHTLRARLAALREQVAGERPDLLLDEGSFVEIDPYRRHQASGLKISESRPHTDGMPAPRRKHGNIPL